MNNKPKIIGFLLIYLLILGIAPVWADSFSASGITFNSPWWEVKAADGTRVLSVDNNGNMYVAATNIRRGTAPSYGMINSLIITLGDTRKFSFNLNDAYIAGDIYTSQGLVTAGDGNDLVIRNNAGTIVARFDSGDGNIYLKGIVNDIDRDGYSAVMGDCDDKNAGRSPGMAEVYDNGIDDNCNGVSGYTVLASSDSPKLASTFCTAGGTITWKHAEAPGGSKFCQAAVGCESNRNSYIWNKWETMPMYGLAASYECSYASKCNNLCAFWPPGIMCVSGWKIWCD